MIKVTIILRIGLELVVYVYTKRKEREERRGSRRKR